MAKNIVICCDGTGNQYGKNNTNVVKIFETLLAQEDQKIFYDPGVGTSSRSILVPFERLKQITSQAFGFDLHRNVEDAYQYLMNVYQDGDRVFLFGFSRGAHTVRRLASLLEKCGLLHRGSENMIPYASRMYLDKSVSKEVSNGFFRTFSRRCPIYFIGVWDTVSAVSSLLPRPRLDGVLSAEVRYAYHAVSIDERRLQFPPNLFREDRMSDGQTVEQVWFAGFHSDVGGWHRERGLSNIALRWMLKKAVNAGLRVKEGAIEKIGEDPLARQHQSWIGFWWFMPHHLYLGLTALILYGLEIACGKMDFSFFPFTGLSLVAKDYWILSLFVFVGLIPLNQRTRQIPKRARVHNSVKTRYEEFAKYRPASLVSLVETKDVIWVD